MRITDTAETKALRRIINDWVLRLTASGWDPDFVRAEAEARARAEVYGFDKGGTKVLTQKTERSRFNDTVTAKGTWTLGAAIAAASRTHCSHGRPRGDCAKPCACGARCDEHGFSGCFGRCAGGNVDCSCPGHRDAES